VFPQAGASRRWTAAATSRRIAQTFSPIDFLVKIFKKAGHAGLAKVLLEELREDAHEGLDGLDHLRD
jgi:hypothetical protein